MMVMIMVVMMVMVMVMIMVVMMVICYETNVSSSNAFKQTWTLDD